MAFKSEQKPSYNKIIFISLLMVLAIVSAVALYFYIKNVREEESKAISLEYYRIKKEWADKRTPSADEMKDINAFISKYKQKFHALVMKLQVANSYMKEAKWEQAEESLKEASNMNPDDILSPIIYLKLAKVQIQLDKDDKALETLNKISLKDPNWTVLVEMTIGDIYYKKSDFKSANEHYQKSWDNLKQDDPIRGILKRKLEDTKVLI